MNIKNWDLTKKIRLYIDNVEMDFSNQFSFQDHPINFSSMTFNNVIPKDKNNYPNILKIWNYGNEFSIGKVYSGSQLIFFGVVNATGRLSLFKNAVKTKSIQIVDFRKWLSIKKPVDLIFYEVSPQFLVTQLIKKLGEQKIKVGQLNFTNDANINAYSTIDKTPFQILKDVVATFTDSLLYFKIENDNTISINYKSNNQILNEMSNIVIDLDNLDLLNDHKILDISFESNADSYANVVRYDSENIVSNVSKQEIVRINDSENYILFNNIAKTINNIEQTYMLNPLTNEKSAIVILSNDRYEEGKYYDVLYSSGKNSIKVNDIWKGYHLYFSYYPKIKSSVQLTNYEEKVKVAKKSQTNGDIYKYDKSNDITNFNDLLKLCQGDLNLNSNISNQINIETESPLFDVGDTVKVISSNHQIENIYLVTDLSGSVKASSFNDQETNNFVLPNFTYTLKSSKNTNSLVNQFDSNSFKSNPVIDENVVFETQETIDIQANIYIESIVENNIMIENKLDYLFDEPFQGIKHNHIIWKDK